MGVKQLAAYHVRLLHKVVEVDTSPIMQLAERIGSRPEEKRQRDKGPSGGSDRDKRSRQAFDGIPQSSNVTPGMAKKLDQHRR